MTDRLLSIAAGLFEALSAICVVCGLVFALAVVLVAAAVLLFALIPLLLAMLLHWVTYELGEWQSRRRWLRRVRDA